MTYEETPRTALKIAKKPTTKKENIDMNKEAYNKTRALHKMEIAKLKQDIKKHKLLAKQARLAYKLSQLKEK